MARKKLSANLAESQKPKQLLSNKSEDLILAVNKEISLLMHHANTNRRLIFD